MYIISILLPIFAITFLGVVLRKLRFFDEPTIKGLNKLSYWVGLPCLLFIKVATATFEGRGAMMVAGVHVISVVLVLLIALLIAWVLRIRKQLVGTFVQGSIYGNVAFIGIPVVLYVINQLYPLQVKDLETVAILSLVPIGPVLNLLAVLVLVGGSISGGAFVKRATHSILGNPLILSTLAGALFAWLHLPLADWIVKVMKTLGETSLPMALIGIGGTLAGVRLKGELRLVGIASLLQVALLPLIGFVVAGLFHLSPELTKIALLYLACPAAVATFVLADQLDGDGVVAAQIVLVSTVLSLLSLAVVIWY